MFYLSNEASAQNKLGRFFLKSWKKINHVWFGLSFILIFQTDRKGGKLRRSKEIADDSRRIKHMCVRASVCVCACVSFCLHVHACACVSFCLHVYAHVCVCVCVCVYSERETEKRKQYLYTHYNWSLAKFEYWKNYIQNWIILWVTFSKYWCFKTKGNKKEKRSWFCGSGRSLSIECPGFESK